MKDRHRRPWLSVITGGESLVSHAGGALLVETARRSGLAKELSNRLGPWRLPFATHDPGKILLDVATAVALGGDAACDVAVLRAQPGVFGPVASDSTVSRLVTRLALDADAALAAINSARAVARERVWDTVGAPSQDGQVVIDLDATLLDAHSEKEDATRTWKKGFGFHQGLRRPPAPPGSGVLPRRVAGAFRHPHRADPAPSDGVDTGVSGPQTPRRRARRADPTA